MLESIDAFSPAGGQPQAQRKSPTHARASWAWLPLLLLVLVLAGCASTLSARVTTFSQWPSGVEGQTYRFDDPGAGQADNLEYQTYRDMVRAALGRTGLVEAPAGTSAARFAVRFRYGTEATQIIVQEPYDPYFYGMPGFYGFNRWGWGGFYGGPTWVPVPVAAYRKSLTVEIRDNQREGAEVYRSTATTVSERDGMVQAMPYLVRAIFDGFPDNNGQVREVKYKRE